MHKKILKNIVLSIIKKLYSSEQQCEIVRNIMSELKSVPLELLDGKTGRPEQEQLYLVQLSDGTMCISYFYKNGSIFRCEMENGMEYPVICYTLLPKGRRQ